MTSKTCNICRLSKTLSMFYRDRDKADGHAGRCIACHKRKRIGWQATRYARRKNGGWPHAALVTCRHRAKKFALPFNLTEWDLRVPKVCPILKIPLVVGKRRMQANMPSVDRLRPECGYVRGNVAVISWRANRIKINETDPWVFDQIAAYLRRHLL